ncbi:unnamed protein product [Spodoptera littoralis]|uniref:Large ribosomal subunit protein mL52 n=1 Tax=Spodoptera littoralis TaxID=7109 RepID=A0A9P0N1W6_SPOLI|nr:unnamed protein product [Spodoptera littoralis]CAH1638527.1 unnamed protein product [Spodoptera littoralis]
MSILLKNIIILPQMQLVSRGLSSTPILLSKHWREERGLSINRNAEGILTDAPDFTYLDGRPTPLLIKQKKRMLRQREFASKIVEMCSELDFAKERYNYIEASKEQERQNVIANRLKTKGNALKKKK